MKLRAINDNILAVTMEVGEQTTAAGIVIPTDEGKERGIRPRWCQIYDIGPTSEFLDDIKKDDWILVAHGRWTHGMIIDGLTVWRIDPEGIMLHSSEQPDEV
jgi:co-chaperonin GroES (HSP10)|tara:strand:- start:420 stop:725 length:306 start_codon:yes stop_codon:yes gene_type:complete